MLRWIQENKTAQKRNLITTAAALICVCGIGLGTWMAGRTPENPDNTLQVQPTIPQQTQPGGNVQLQPVRLSLDYYENDEYPKEYVAESEHLRNGGAVMVWMLSEDMRWKLCNDPTIPLSSITSTITTTVNIKDGTQVISVVDVSGDDEGFVYFTSRGETTV